MAITCSQTITLLYIYFCVWELDLRLNNINLYQSLSFIICIDLNHHCHHYWTSESLLNLWECTQGSDITNQWVVHFVIKVVVEVNKTKKSLDLTLELWNSIRCSLYLSESPQDWLRCANLWNDLDFSLCVILSVCYMVVTSNKRKKSKIEVSTD